jgi:proline iminopeptidase
MKVKIGILVLLLLSLSSKSDLTPHEGYVKVTGGNIWYKVLGSGSGIPLIAIHGGPGGRSCGYIKGFSRLAKERPIIIYDQLESGNSDRPGDTTLWKLERFVEELVLLRKALDIKECHIIGSSWGAAIAVEYMLTQDTSGVISVIFSGPLISTDQWIKDAKVLLSRLSENVQDTITKYEKLGDFTATSYLAATDSFYSEFLTRRNWPPKYSNPDCKKVPGFNEKIYNHMWGPSEFTMRGTLRDFNRVDDLHKLSQPVLFIIGEYDEVLPETAKKYHQRTPHSVVSITKDAAHSQLGDQPEKYTEAIRQFLRTVEAE